LRGVEKTPEKRDRRAGRITCRMSLAPLRE